MSIDVLEQAETMRDANAMRARISLTDLNRGTAWRTELEDNGIIEVMERNQPAAYVLTPQTLYDMVDRINEYASQIETMTVEGLFKARSDDGQALNGEALAEAALKDFDAHSDAMMGFVNEKAE